jgi:uncharacterized protein (TIGR02145 family)
MNQISKNQTKKSIKFLFKIALFTSLVLVFIFILPGCEEKLLVDFNADKTEITIGVTVQFTDETSPEAESWEWEFQGGTPSTSKEKNPTITYNEAGSFQVTLLVWSDDKKYQTYKYDYITVTESSTLTDVDNNNYELVLINEKYWMAENLRTTKYRDGSDITTGLDSSTWVSTAFGAYAIYDNSTTNENKYGMLYNYYAASDPRGICPEGWHIPTKEEFDAMVTFLGGEDEAGGALRTTTGWTEPNTGATNSSGFSALPGGFRTTQNDYNALGTHAYFMTLGTDQSYSYLLPNGETGFLFGFYGGKQAGNSCRCVKD